MMNSNRRQSTTALIVMVAWVPQIAAQIDMPADSVLFGCLANYYQEVEAAQIAAHEYREKGSWLKYVPDVGVTYTVAGDPRPAVSFSTGVIYQAMQDKKKKAATITAIGQTVELSYQEERAELEKSLREVRKRLQNLDADDELREIENELFELYRQEYENLEITPEQFLLKKRSYLQSVKRWRTEVQEIEALQLEIMRLAKCF